MIQNKISQRISTYKLISSSRWSDFCVPGDFSGSIGDWITKISAVTKPFVLWVSRNRSEQNHKKCRRYSVSKNRKMNIFSSWSVSFQGSGFFLNCFEPDSSWSADLKKIWVYYDQTCCKALKYILVQAPLRNTCNQSQWCILTYT